MTIKEFQATILLADHAQVSDGKLFISGAGWTAIGPVMGPYSLALILDVPWSEANRRHSWSLLLQTEDGEPVVLDGPAGSQPIQVGGDFEVGRPPGTPEGIPLQMPLAVSFGPMPLEGGKRYQWRLVINGGTRDTWVRAFSVRSAT